MTDIAALGASLIQFLWQGIFLAVALRVILLFCKTPIVRYNWALATLCALTICPIATFFFLKTNPSAADGLSSLSTVWALVTSSATQAGSSQTIPHAPTSWLEWTVAFWLLGVILFGARAIGGSLLTARYRYEGVAALPDEIGQLLDGLRRRLSIAAPITCFQSNIVRVPMVVGWWRPAILVPAATLLRLSRPQLEAILAHELAHIARLDAFANGFQMVVETLLFYHPAIWWVSREIRIEREHCCDDLAIGLCGDPVSYGRALAELAGETAAIATLAAGGGDLNRRIKRLFDVPNTRRSRPLSGYVAIVMSLVLGGVVAVAAVAAPNASEHMAIYPRPTAQVPPKYPQEALDNGLVGDVEMDFTIAVDGSVTDIKIVRAEVEATIRSPSPTTEKHIITDPNNVFNDAAVTALRAWHYTAQIVDGKAVPTPNRRAIIRFALSAPEPTIGSPKPMETHMSPETLARYAGLYSLGPAPKQGGPMEVKNEPVNARILATPNGLAMEIDGKTQNFQPISEVEFFDPSAPNKRLTFEMTKTSIRNVAVWDGGTMTLLGARPKP